jgi:hypothetical protein
LTKQNLCFLRLRAKARSDLAYRADRGVAGALGKSDLAERRVSLRDTGAKAQLATQLTLAARRADFSSTLRNQGVPGLIAKLRR